MVGPILPLKVRGACVTRRGKRLVGPIDLTVDPVGVTMVMGPNGAGKTTLLRLMHGLERASAGSVEWRVPVAQARSRQSFVFQAPVVLRRSVVDNIAFPLIVHGQGRRAARRQAAEWAERVGLGDALTRPAAVLSGGEKQKLALARALITAPEAVFLDEPTASLDGRAMREIEAILIDAAKGGARIVMSTHNIGQAKRLATDVIFLYHGQVHEQGEASGFFSQPKTQEASAFLKGDIVE